MGKGKVKIWILHAGIDHPSPYFYNFCSELNTYENYEYIINPELPLEEKVNKGIIYFNRLKRFYNNDDVRILLNSILKCLTSVLLSPFFCSTHIYLSLFIFAGHRLSCIFYIIMKLRR